MQWRFLTMEVNFDEGRWELFVGLPSPWAAFIMYLIDILSQQQQTMFMLQCPATKKKNN